MRLLLLVLFMIINLNAQDINDTQIYLDKNDKPLSAKKQRFLELILPPLKQVYDRQLWQYNEVKYYMDRGMKSHQIDNLKQAYHITDDKKLLMTIYPIPKSIVLAQASMESNWATSRFFKEANNIFGVWSYNKNEPRIPALKKRGDKTIYLKKYDNIKQSIKDYYHKISHGKNFVKLRKDCYNHKSSEVLANDLDKYSEIGKQYSKHLISIIRYNRFEEFDR